MGPLAAHGLAVETPTGWEGRIFRRPQYGEVAASTADAPGPAAPPGEQSYPVVHVATIPLPSDVADYASDAVDRLGPNDAIIVIKEFAPALAAQALFRPAGIPRPLDPDAFDPAGLQRRLRGQAGLQRFFHEARRAFCLYIVLGAYANRHAVVPRVNAVLATVSISTSANP